MTKALNFYLCPGIMFGDEKAALLALRQKIGSPQKIASNGLHVTSVEAASRDEALLRRKHQRLEYRGQVTGRRDSSIHRARTRTARITAASARTRRWSEALLRASDSEAGKLLIQI